MGVAKIPRVMLLMAVVPEQMLALEIQDLLAAVLVEQTAHVTKTQGQLAKNHGENVFTSRFYKGWYWLPSCRLTFDSLLVLFR